MWKLITAESFPGPCRAAAVRTVCKTEGLTALQAGSGAQRSWGTGQLVASLPRAACPFWGLLPRHGHHVVVPVTAASAECCAKPGRGLLCSPRSLGSSSEWEKHGLGGQESQGVGRQAVCRRALGGEGEGSQMPTIIVHPAFASRANCFQPCLQLCSAPPRGLSRCGHTEQTGRESPVWLSGGKALLTTSRTSLFLLSQAELPSSL